MTTRIPTVTALVLAAATPAAVADTPTEPARPRVAVAAADPAAPTPTELAILLAPVAETPAPTATPPGRRTPRFQVTAGPYTTTRALAFAVAETTPVDELPETPPESTLVGARVEVAIFPAGGADRRGRLVGPGVTASYRHSVGGTAGYDDLEAEESWDLPVIDAGWSLGLRYRQPLGPALVEVGLSHDSASRRVDERPDWLELPDAEYRSVAGSLRLELSVRPGAVIALGGSYHHVLDAGELMAVDGYGAGTISAYGAEAGVDVALAGPLFASGGLALHQVAIEFAGDGALSIPAGEELADVYGATDRTVSAHLALGLRY